MTRIHLKRGLAIIALGLCFAVKSASVGGQAAAGSQPQEKTVEQTRKNIQVLKGLPDSQLQPMMNIIAASLGVKCIFCHVKQGEEWQWEKDDKKAKQTARKMIQMTLDINKNSFEGKPEVGCYTCHQGEEHPATVPPLPRPQDSPEAGARQNRPLVTPQQVLEKYVQAVGGKEAVAKLKTRVLKGTHVTSNGISLPLEVRFSSPDRLLTVVTTPRQGVFYQGLSGAGGWIKNDREQRAMDPVEAWRIKSLAWSLDPLELKEPYPRLNFGGTDKIGDREVYILRMNTPDRRRVRFYFDTQTGLLLRRVVLTDTIIGPDPEQTDFEDYRDVEGVKVAFTIRTSYLDNYFSATRKFTEVKHNAALDELQFSPPAAK
jgi:photosynthetic reaction center cytochrome c subunit